MQNRIIMSVHRASIPFVVASIMLFAVLSGLAASSDGVHAAQFASDEEGNLSFTERVLLPLAINRYIDIDLQVTGTTDASGGETRGFLPGEELFFSLTGRNPSTTTTSADVVWVQEGPCLPEETIYSGPVEMKPGSWSFWQVGVAPECLGIYTHTLQFSFQNITNTIKTNYAVMHPSVNIVDSIHAFDKCNAPSTLSLQTWWKDSPYKALNLYIGGISRFCDNVHLDAVWIYQASEMGWTFIPTWVGPQAPCTNYKYRMSSNAATAYEEGRAEARAAAYKARQLGLLEERVIYYDIESYRYKITTCNESVVRKAVSSFMTGWAEQLDVLGLQAGVYGSPSGSYLVDLSEISPAIDHVWFTHWYTNTFDAEATVWYTDTTSATNLPDYVWPDRQRIKQYTDGHYETWGRVTFSIDSNVVDGGLTAVVAPAVPAAASVVSTDSVSDSDTSTTVDQENMIDPGLIAAGPVDAGVGWAVSADGLLWTEDEGQTWKEKTPEHSQGRPLGAYFWANGRGLYLTQGESLEAWLTTNSGETWQSVRLPVREEAASAWLGSSDSMHAWIALEMKTGSNWSEGRLFITADGGSTWIERTLPVGGEVYFANEQQGWLLGGPEGDEYYSTVDGGQTWQRQANLPSSNHAEGEDVYPLMLASSAGHPRLIGALPENAVRIQWMGDRTAWVTTQDGVCTGDKTRAGEATPLGSEAFRCTQDVQVMQTVDGGLTWSEISLLTWEDRR